METIFFLLPLVLVLAAVGVAAFFWALRHGQFDDLQTPAVRILFDEDSERSSTSAPAPKADPPESNE